MRMKSDAKFEEKLTCGLENDMSNMGNVHQEHQKNLKIGTLMGSFYGKQKMYELKIYREIIYHDSEE